MSQGSERGGLTFRNELLRFRILMSADVIADPKSFQEARTSCLAPDAGLPVDE